MNDAIRLPMDRLNESLSTPIDLFLCCASYEIRSIVAPKALSPESSLKTVIFFNREFENESRCQVDALQTHWGATHETKALAMDAPLDTADTFIAILQKTIAASGKPSVVVDSTTFTKESLIILIKALYEKRHSLGPVSLIYSVAATMADDWLSRGVTEIRPILGFAGLPLPSRPLHLAVLTGFEIDRTRIVIDEYEPDIISIGCGSEESSISAHFYSRNQQFVKNLVSLYGDRVKQFEFSLLDPVEAMRNIEAHLAPFTEHNTVISAMNNKISTIGAAFLGLSHEEYQLCYAQASSYNVSHYSTPSDHAIVMPIDWSAVQPHN